MKKLIIIASALVLAACAFHRFESIATCEFESRAFWGLQMWSSSNCLGDKDATSHAKKSLEELQRETTETTEE